MKAIADGLLPQEGQIVLAFNQPDNWYNFAIYQGDKFIAVGDNSPVRGWELPFITHWTETLIDDQTDDKYILREGRMAPPQTPSSSEIPTSWERNRKRGV